MLAARHVGIYPPCRRPAHPPPPRCPTAAPFLCMGNRFCRVRAGGRAWGGGAHLKAGDDVGVLRAVRDADLVEHAPPPLLVLRRAQRHLLHREGAPRRRLLVGRAPHGAAAPTPEERALGETLEAQRPRAALGGGQLREAQVGEGGLLHPVGEESSFARRSLGLGMGVGRGGGQAVLLDTGGVGVSPSDEVLQEKLLLRLEDREGGRAAPQPVFIQNNVAIPERVIT